MSVKFIPGQVLTAEMLNNAMAAKVDSTGGNIDGNLNVKSTLTAGALVLQKPIDIKSGGTGATDEAGAVDSLKYVNKSGGVKRSLYDKFSDVVCVKDFGAIGDGVNDDSDALIKAPVGAKIPKGTYNIGKDIGNKWFNLEDGVILKGAYANTVQTKPQQQSLNKNFYLASFFDTTNFYNRPLGFFTSADGFQFNQVGEINNVNWTQISAADPDWMYQDGYFYVVATEYVKGDHDMRVYKSPDLCSWTYQDVKLGSGICGNAAPGWTYVNPNGQMLWAPQWFKDTDNRLYVIISIQCTADQTTVEGTQPYFRQFISECTSLANLTFSAPVEMNINGKKGPAQCANTDNMIDGAMFKLPDGRYIFAVKSEYSKQILTYTATSLTGNFTPLSTNVFAPLGNVYMEGPCIAVFNNGSGDMYLLYADDYYSNNVYVCYTTDFINFSNHRTIEQRSFARHGSVKNIGRLPAHEFKEITDKLAIANAFLSVPARNDIYAHKRLQELPGYPTLSAFAPENGTLYVAYGDMTVDEVVISGIANTTSYVDGSYFYLSLFCSNSYLNGVPKRIKINAGVLKGSQPTLYLSPHNQNADGLYKIVKDHGEWVIQDLGSKIKNANLYEMQYIINFKNGINNGSLTWYPADGGVYFTTGADTYSSPTTIYDLPNTYNEGAMFYLQIRSGIDNGKIILKASSNTWWGGDITIDKTDDSKLVGFRFVAGRWALVK